MSVEAKVGAFTIGGLMMLGATVLGFSDLNIGKSNDFTLYAGFKQVIGLEPQSSVRLSGVPIGKVETIGNDGGGVTVTMNLDPKVKIPKDSRVLIGSTGVMGEKFINILPSQDNGEYLQNGDYVYGTEEAGMDSMFEGMGKTLEKVDIVLESVNKIIGDDKFQNYLLGATKNMDELMATLNKMAKDNEGNIASIISQMDSVMRSMDASMANVEHMTANIDKFAGDPQTVADLKNTLKNVSETSNNVAKMAENMNKFAGDPQVAEDLKATVHNARNLTERADKMLSKVEGASEKFSSIKFKPSVDVLYSGKKSDWNTNFNVDVSMGKNSLNLGVEDIGDHSKLNAQVGTKFNDDVGARAGVVAGKVGAGLDFYAGKSLKLSAEAYDPNDVKVRLKSQVKVADSTYILGEWHDVNHKKDRAAYVGIKQEF